MIPDRTIAEWCDDAYRYGLDWLNGRQGMCLAASWHLLDRIQAEYPELPARREATYASVSGPNGGAFFNGRRLSDNGWPWHAVVIVGSGDDRLLIDPGSREFVGTPVWCPPTSHDFGIHAAHIRPGWERFGPVDWQADHDAGRGFGRYAVVPSRRPAALAGADWSRVSASRV